MNKEQLIALFEAKKQSEMEFAKARGARDPMAIPKEDTTKTPGQWKRDKVFEIASRVIGPEKLEAARTAEPRVYGPKVKGRR